MDWCQGMFISIKNNLLQIQYSSSDMLYDSFPCFHSDNAINFILMCFEHEVRCGSLTPVLVIQAKWVLRGVQIPIKILTQIEVEPLRKFTMNDLSRGRCNLPSEDQSASEILSGAASVKIQIQLDCLNIF